MRLWLAGGPTETETETEQKGAKVMAKLYKLTDEYGKTQNDTQWGPGVTHSGTGEGGLCGPGWIHAYEHPLIAVLMNPIHADFKTPRLWKAEGEVGLRDGQLKCGCTILTTIREIPFPKITTEMRVRFAILCAKRVHECSTWNAWADRWLLGEDRSAASAYEAWELARRPAAWALTRRPGTAGPGWVAAAAAAEAADAAADRDPEAPWTAVSRAAEASVAACCGIDLAAIAEKACAMSLE